MLQHGITLGQCVNISCFPCAAAEASELLVGFTLSSSGFTVQAPDPELAYGKQVSRVCPLTANTNRNGLDQTCVRIPSQVAKTTKIAEFCACNLPILGPSGVCVVASNLQIG